MTMTKLQRRLIAALALIGLVFFLLLWRIAFLQFVQADFLQSKGERQWTRTSVVMPLRGKILDTNGNVLAQSTPCYIVSASPAQVKAEDREKFAALIAPALEMQPEEIVKKLESKSGGVYIKRQVPREVYEQLLALQQAQRQQKEDSKLLNAMYFEEDAQRSYPMDAMLGQVLGLTNYDGKGQSGLEMEYDKFLSGTPGSITREVDVSGRELQNGVRSYVAAEEGHDLVLTIDLAIQYFAEKAAQKALEENKAKSVQILVMDAQTSAILAMAAEPGSNPNEPPRNDIDALMASMRNPLIMDAYEPGSTFKILTMAAALEEKVTSLHEHFYCTGSIIVDGDRIKCWRFSHPHGDQTLTQALENSCNPVFVTLALRLGQERFYEYLTRFGIGSATGIDLPGEANGLVTAAKYVRRTDLARIGFGQSIAVTPLQLLAAASSVVNGGNLMQPYIVQEIRDNEGNVIQQMEPTLVGKTISESTSQMMREMLESVVETGGGKNAKIDGYRVSGKTGTAQKYQNGAIVTNVHIGSFLGFAPADDPKIAVLVIVDEAQVQPDYGSVTAAPYARQVIESTLQYLGVARSTQAATEMVEVPVLEGLSTEAASAQLRALGFEAVTDGSGPTVLTQMPAAGSKLAKGSQVLLYVSPAQAQTPQEEKVQVPNLKGFSLVEVNRRLKEHNLKLQVSGSGIAYAQSVEAGTWVDPGATIVVSFAPPG